jgi:hypothetical protein
MFLGLSDPDPLDRGTVQMRGSASVSVPKCHGSTTLVFSHNDGLNYE